MPSDLSEKCTESTDIQADPTSKLVNVLLIPSKSLPRFLRFPSDALGIRT